MKTLFKFNIKFIPNKTNFHLTFHTLPICYEDSGLSIGLYLYLKVFWYINKQIVNITSQLFVDIIYKNDTRK